MRKQDFTNQSPGQLVSIGELGIAFLPNPLPPDFSVYGDLQHAHEEAMLSLGELRASIPSLPNPTLITTPFLRREAVLSSRIEGTHTEVEQLYLFEADEPKAKGGESEDVQDARQVLNYVRALNHGLKSLESRSISNFLIKELHQLLLEGVRWDGKSPAGQYRILQNYIGGGRIQEARFVPPPGEMVQGLMDSLVQYIEAPRDLPTLVKIAFVHYQFETIHPFEDGNGRIGRLLVTLLLSRYKLLPEPLLYLSAYFERNRRDYYDFMLNASRAGKWHDWVAFFLDGVQSEAQDASRRARKLLNLRESWRDKLQQGNVSANLLALVDSLFKFPVISINRAAKVLELSYKGAQKNVERLESEGFLVEVTGNQRNRQYLAKPITEILNADSA
ncbi:MAG: Fic family protein [Planctomycetota bacterium]|nr:Fic family protein [Planctomycetota bacterium]